jgi:hypothetical protein
VQRATIALRYRPDPPPALDGNVDEWRQGPPPLVLDRREQVTFGATAWKSPADCSARVWLAWRADGLYLAAEVSDDHLRQFGRGAEIYKGDSVQLLLDLAPDEEPARDSFGPHQFQISFSPGNLRRSGDPSLDLPAEAHCYRPAGRAAASIRVASTATPNGWNLEALVPWNFLGVNGAAAGLTLRCEVAVSDTDGTEPRQEKWLTSSPARWTLARSRLGAAALARADGVVPPPPPRTTALFADLALATGGKQSFHFSASPLHAGEEAILTLQARMHATRPAGFTPALVLTLNGQVLDGARLVHKPLKGAAADGRTYTLVAGQRFSTFYAPDFTAADQSPYGIAGVKTGEFELRVSDLLRAGDNELTIANAAAPNVKPPLHAAQARIVVGPAAAAAPPVRAGPPTGPLPVIVPAAEHRTNYEVASLPDARLELRLAGATYAVESEFSTPDGKWVRGTNPHFTHTRVVERRAEAVIVRDTFANRTGENLPLMQRHRVKAGTPWTRLWLAGLTPAGLEGAANDSQNPSVYGATAAGGIGLLPLNDEFQVHVRQEAAGGAIGLSDRQFVLRPGANYTAEWALVPTARGDYYDFVNAARRLLDANFTLKECFAFLRAGPLTEKWSDAQFADFIRHKSADLVCASISYPVYRGVATHGTSFQRVAQDSRQRWLDRVHRLAPGVRTVMYFHCFLDTVEDSPVVFADSRHLRADGTQADYGQPIYKNFLPTLDNSYGRAIARNVDLILDSIRADGVYWDELEYSAYAYHYGEPWDGCSADIDPGTHRITRLKSSVTLVTQPWRLALAQRILARGPLIANGQPRTRTMARLHFPHFVETGSPSNHAHAQLHSPIGLGDHLTERSEADAYRSMLSALDYGCLYHWYSDAQVVPEYPTLTKYMYPSTPLELHAGYHLARERILTKVSGEFGWDDASAHEVHVFDETGREVAGFRAPLIRRDGKTYTELRLAEGWSAAIVRKP